MSNGVRIFVEGRITVEGTSSCPVYFDFAGGGDHMGIQFNSSSNGRGSKIDNASIIHSTYGITIYGSDPYLANVTVWNADDVAVDMFNLAKRDQDVESRARKSINTYSKYFPTTEVCFFNNVEKNSDYRIECWINKTTVVRTSD